MKTALIRNAKLKRVTGPIEILGTDLQDYREENFVRMVCDGLPIGAAFERAGFKATDNDAAYKLWRLDRIQQRAAIVFESRRTTGAVTLAEVTDMLKRTYAGAASREEYNAAHNAAFSLARLYGHVTDRSTVEVIRRPSRDPDAPAEQALTNWVDSLPGPIVDAQALPAPALPGPEAADRPALEGASQRARQPATAGPGLDGQALDWASGLGSREHVSSGLGSGLGSAGPRDNANSHSGLEALNVSSDVSSTGKPNEINSLAGPGEKIEIENGAPTRPVTGTPSRRGRSKSLRRGGNKTKGAPSKPKRVPPPIGDLF